MKKLLIAGALALALAGSPAHADNYLVKDGKGFIQTFASKLVGLVHHQEVVIEGFFSGAPKPVAVDADGNVGTYGTAFAGAGNSTISMTTSSARIALPTSGPTVVIYNAATSPAHIKLGTSSVTAATTDQIVPAGTMWVASNAAGNADIAAILESGSGTLYVTTGTGSPFATGTGAGSGGGAVTISGTLPGFASTPAFTISGTLPAYAATPTFNLGALNGAATAAKQPALGTAGSPSIDVLTVQGSGSGTALPVSAASLPLPSGASTSALQTTINSSIGATNTAIANLTGTKAAGTAAANSLLVGGVYNSAGVTLINGQQASAQLDASGRLITNCGTGCASATPWTPSGQAAQTLSATTTSSAVTLTSPGPVVVAINDGTSPVFVRVGAGTPTALTTDTRILPGQFATFASAAAVAGITSSGTASVRLETGTGTYQAGLSVDAGKTSAVVGSAASGASLTDPPVVAGCRASSTAPTAVSDGQVVAQRCGLKGGAVEHPFTIRELASRSSLVTVSSTTETTLMAAGGAGVFLDMASIKLCNTSATAVRADIRDATGGNVQDTWYLPAGQCEGATYTTPLKQTTAANNWTIQLSGAVTDVRAVAQFVQQ